MKTGGIAGVRLFCVLKQSDNEHLTYPCVGLLEVQEVSSAGTIINATFRPYTEGGMLPFVRVKHPVFEVRDYEVPAKILKAQPGFFE